MSNQSVCPMEEHNEKTENFFYYSRVCTSDDTDFLVVSKNR